MPGGNACPRPDIHFFVQTGNIGVPHFKELQQTLIKRRIYMESGIINWSTEVVFLSQRDNLKTLPFLGAHDPVPMVSAISH